MIDKEAIENHIRGIIEALGDDPARPGIADTPKRVAAMCCEVFEGMNYTNRQIAEMFDRTFDDDIDTDQEKIVVMRDIEFFSYCEHHMALMYDMKANVAYIPNGRVIGLSKIVRVCEMVGKRLQLQERICYDIAEIIEMVTGSSDVAVFIEASHSCMTARGIKNASARTYTQTLRGRFKEDGALLARLK